MADLKTCPFCDGKAKIHTEGITAITCTKCGIIFSNAERSITKLKSQWNTRLGMKPLQS